MIMEGFFVFRKFEIAQEFSKNKKDSEQSEKELCFNDTVNEGSTSISELIL